MTTITAPAPATENELQALGYLVRHERASRGDLAHSLGITPQGAKDIVDRLQARRIEIEEDDEPTGKGGQPARMYTLIIPSSAQVLSVDIGYHYLRVAACRPRGELIEIVDDVDGLGLRDSEPPEVFDRLSEIVRSYLENQNAADLVGVGIAVAGPINPDEGMLRAGSAPDPWQTVDFAKELKARFPDHKLRVAVANDANLGVLAEHRLGVAKGVDDAVYVRWTAGIGVGLVLAGQPYRGARGIAGELGHVVFGADSGGATEPPSQHDDAHDQPSQNDDARNQPSQNDGAADQHCDCGNESCLQSLAGTDAIISAAKKSSHVLRVRKDEIDIRDVIAAAGKDDGARGAIEQAAGYLGQTLAIVVDLLNPDLVVLGGAFGQDDYSLVVPGIQRAMRSAAIQPAFRDARIVMATYSGRPGGSVLRGAAIDASDTHLADWLLQRP